MTDYEVFELMNECRRLAGKYLAVYNFCIRHKLDSWTAYDNLRRCNRQAAMYYRELRRRAKEVIGE